MRVVIKNNSNEVLVYAAKHVAKCISEYAPTEDRPFTMVLPNPTELNCLL